MIATLLAAVLGLTLQPKVPHTTQQSKASPLVVLGPEVSTETPVQLGISLKLTHPTEMAALRQAQLDPKSPSYRQWLTPVQFGEQFGQPQALIARTQAWLQAAGFEVTVYDNRSFIEAIGTAAQVKALFNVKLNSVVGARASVHVPSQAPELPAWLAPQTVYVSGLDTRVRAHHRLYDSFGDLALGPQDVRTQYDITPLLQQGYYGQEQQLVVLAWAEAPGNEVQAADVNYFYQNVSNARATFNEVKIYNPNGDFDDTDDGRVEFELDVEMQSVGSPGATSINLVDSPASAIFTTGAQYVVQNFPSATAVSTSIGECEIDEAMGAPGESATMEAAVIQGTMEGQTWSAAAGDNGADDCQTGGPASVDFPGVLPEVVSMGGSQIVPATFDANTALQGVNTEEVWNDTELTPPGTDASGGGISTIFAAPPYQTGMGFTFREVPDLALIAGQPYTIAVTNQPGEFDPLEGTSIASPLSAGFFGMIASYVGCRLGDPHSLIYTLGQAQLDGGIVVFNDITTGNNNIDGVTGFSAGVGYDPVSGWGSMDVYQLAQFLAFVYPTCPSDGGFETNNGGENGAEYSQCKFSGCTTSDCTTINDKEGPSTCTVTTCDPAKADAGNGSGNQCPINSACFTSGPYAGNGDGGACANGCIDNSDCSTGSCNGCYNNCQAAGTAGASIGGPCSTDSDCGPGGSCITETEGVLYDGGYCSANCNPFSDVCANLCGTGGSCQPFGNNFYTCLQTCTTNADCTRPGYQCQAQSNYCGDAGSVFSDPSSGQPCPSVCEPGCSIVDAGPDFGIYNTCMNPWASCNPATGVCTIVPGGGVVITNGTTGSVGTIGTTGSIGTTGATGSTTGEAGTTTGTHGATTGVAAASTGHGSTTGATGTTGTHGTTGSAAASSSGSAAASTSNGGAIAAASGSSTGAGGSGGGCATGSGSPDLMFGLLGLGLLVWRRRRS